jgi:hypothetical protein
VWKNLWATPASESTKELWYRVIHDIVPTRECLHNIRLAPTAACSICNMPDTLRHRITECGNGRSQWEWTRKRLALMLRTDPECIPEEWLYRPHFTIWAPRRYSAMLWTIAHVVAFRMQIMRTLTFHDYTDFLRRYRWKLYQQRNRMEQVGSCLCTLDWWPPQPTQARREWGNPDVIVVEIITSLH